MPCGCYFGFQLGPCVLGSDSLMSQLALGLIADAVVFVPSLQPAAQSLEFFLPVAPQGGQNFMENVTDDVFLGKAEVNCVEDVDHQTFDPQANDGENVGHINTFGAQAGQVALMRPQSVSPLGVVVEIRP